MKFFLIHIIWIFASKVNSHAYLADPPARSSAWLFDKEFVKCCKYYNHMEMFCGGTEKQWIVNGGKCGICGEEWNTTKKFEKGGEMYLGKIVRAYTQGESINATVVITANHFGWFEFRICNIDNWESDATQECLNQTVLRYTESNDTRLMVKNYSSSAVVSFLLDLPADLTCNHCVLQWKYRCGNRWGRDEKTNTSCVGCGNIQEHFFGCADIMIKPKESNNTKPLIINQLVTSIQNSSINNITTTTIENNSSTSTLSNQIQQQSVDNNLYNGCRSKLYYGKRIDLSKAILMYCSIICRTSCNNDDNSTLDIYEKAVICEHTCPTLCSCI